MTSEELYCIPHTTARDIYSPGRLKTSNYKKIHTFAFLNIFDEHATTNKFVLGGE